jgi:hypothetical protein
MQPLIIPANLFPDMSESERLEEIELMISRQTALYQAIDGRLPASDLLDFIDSQGYEVDAWIEDLDTYGST